MYHLEQSEAHISEMEVFAFFKKHLLHWFEAMSLMGIISEAMEIIHKLQSLEKSMSSELPKFLYDTRRFIVKHMHVIDTAPLQLYCSALVFSPTESIIRKTFENERARRIRMLPPVESSWSAEPQTLEGHSDSVESVTFSRDGRILASVSDDETIKLWDVRTGETLHTIEGHSDSVRSVAFSPDPDSRILASGSEDDTIKLWDTKTGEELHTLEGHSDSHQAQKKDHTVKLWDSKTGKVLHKLEGHSGAVKFVTFSTDSRVLISESTDRTIKLWDTQMGKSYRRTKTHRRSSAIWIPCSL
ncbi:hypothetical protein HAV15_001338 [Penicillium sp. str. |nr:hypothetical protein HAV15_001338 [Penicillium sp. str. \